MCRGSVQRYDYQDPLQRKSPRYAHFQTDEIGMSSGFKKERRTVSGGLHFNLFNSPLVPELLLEELQFCWWRVHGRNDVKMVLSAMAERALFL